MSIFDFGHPKQSAFLYTQNPSALNTLKLRMEQNHVAESKS